ncbi:MAG: hypothetical protein QOE72_3770, partial [Chloroflexota bacterium]|nr:hypothetical protein [Chloroflexota bacterium]
MHGSAAGGDTRQFCRRVGMLGRSAARGEARLICRRCGVARRFCGRWRCPAVLPPVEIRVWPLCRRSRIVLPPVFTRGGLRPPRSVARHRALARPMPAPAPPRRHSPAALASRSLFGAATRRGTTRATPALLLENPTIRGEGGRLGAAGKAVMPMRGLKHPPVKPLGGSIVSNAQRCSWSLDPSTLHDKRAKRASPASAGVEGVCHGIGRASARCLWHERREAEPPPGKNTVAERCSTGARAARRQSRPAAELPRISTQAQIGRATPPAAVLPGIATRQQIGRASPPAADRPSITTGGRTAGISTGAKNGRASPPPRLSGGPRELQGQLHG